MHEHMNGGANDSRSTKGRDLPRRRLIRANPREIGIGVLVAIAAVFVYLVYHGARASDLLDPAAMDYAQIARNLTRGEGFSTNLIRPMSLARVHNISHHPDLYHGPLHPLWMSLFFRLGGPTAQMAAWSCGVAYLLSLPLVFYIASRLFDRRIAMLSLALYAINYLSLQYAVSGLETSLATLIATLLVLTLYWHLKAPASSAAVTAALCGGIAALAFLTEYIYGSLLVPVLGAIAWRRGHYRWAEMIVCLAVFALVATPWAVRNTRVAGNPFFTLQLGEFVSNTTTHKGHALFRRFAPLPNPLSFMVAHPREMWQKIRPMTLSMYESIPSLGGPFVAAFFLAGVFVRLGDRALSDLRCVHYAWLALLTGLLCLVSGDARFLVALSPLVVIIAAATFVTLLDTFAERIQGLRRKRQVVAWSIGVFVGICWYPVLGTTATWESRPTGSSDELKRIAGTLRERKVWPVVADQPWALAWYGDLEAIWLPQTSEDLHAMESAVGPMRYMVLSPLITSAGDQEGLAPWAELYAAAMRGLRAPHERFIAADVLGERGQWVLFGRIPEGAETTKTPPS